MKSNSLFQSVAILPMVVRSYDEELEYLERLSPHCWRIKKGFQPNMKVEGVFYVNSPLEKLMLEELRNACRPGQVGGFLPGVKQIANVAALPGIVGRSVGLPDIHSGYGFAIGNMAAFDMEVTSTVLISQRLTDLSIHRTRVPWCPRAGWDSTSTAA